MAFFPYWSSRRVKDYTTRGCNWRTDTIKPPTTRPQKLGAFSLKDIKDETVCIRCGLCAERCPTGAITMERFIFKEVPACQVA